MNTTDVINLSVGIISLILAVIAMAQAIYFYVKAKDTEKETSNILIGIKAQTEALQKLHGRMIDRLTRYATDDKPSYEIITQMVAVIKDLPINVATQLRAPESAKQSASTSDLADEHISEFVSCYIVVYYYAVVTNILGQFSLPSPERYNSDDSVHRLLARFVDMSAADVAHMEKVLKKVHQSWLELSPHKHLHDEAKNQWREMVRTSTDVMASRAKNSE